MKISHETFKKWIREQYNSLDIKDKSNAAGDIGVMEQSLSTWLYAEHMANKFNLDNLLAYFGWHIELNGEKVTCAEIPVKINAIRKEKKLTHAELTQMAGLPPKYLIGTYDGKYFSWEKIYMLCDVLGATLEMLPDKENSNED